MLESFFKYLLPLYVFYRQHFLSQFKWKRCYTRPVFFFNAGDLHDHFIVSENTKIISRMNQSRIQLLIAMPMQLAILNIHKKKILSIKLDYVLPYTTMCILKLLVMSIDDDF